MGTFPTDDMELTRLLVVSDLDRSRAWYTNVLGATAVRDYGNTSSVLRLLGNWLLIVTGGGPTEDKPTVTFAPPTIRIARAPSSSFECRTVARRMQSFGSGVPSS